MALQNNFTKNVYGETLVFSEAYYQISGIRGSKERLNVSVLIYKDSSKSITLGNLSFSFVPSNEDDSLRWDKQAYEYIKTLDEFSEAIDV